MGVYKINYYQDDYYDGGEGKWITIYRSKTPISPEKFLEISKEYIVKELRETESDEVVNSVRYEDLEQTEHRIYFVACTGDPDNPSLSDYEWEAEFEYVEPISKDAETWGWCDF